MRFGQSGCDCHSPDPCASGRLNTSPFCWACSYRRLDPRTRIDRLFQFPIIIDHLPSSLPSPVFPFPTLPYPLLPWCRAVLSLLRCGRWFALGLLLRESIIFLSLLLCRPLRKLSSAQLRSAWARGARDKTRAMYVSVPAAHKLLLTLCWPLYRPPIEVDSQLCSCTLLLLLQTNSWLTLSPQQQQQQR